MKKTTGVFGLLVALGLLAGCTKKESASTTGSGEYRVYVTSEVSGDLSVIDSRRMEVAATVPLGKRPRGIHASPDRKLIYVALSGSPIAGPGVDESTLPPPDKSADGIGVFDVEQSKLVRMIKSGSDPENFDLSADGKLLYVSNEDAEGVSILDIGAGQVLETLRIGEEPEGVRLTPDGKQVWVTSEGDGAVGIVDTGSRKVLKVMKVGRRPRSIAFLPNASKAYVTAENDGNVVVVDPAKQEAGTPISLGKPGVIKPMAVLMSTDGSELYVSTGRGKQVFVVDTASNQVKWSVEVGQRPWGIALSPDGKMLFSANGPSNDVAVVDLATHAVVKKIPVKGSPWGVVAVGP